MSQPPSVPPQPSGDGSGAPQGQPQQPPAQPPSTPPGHPVGHPSPPPAPPGFTPYPGGDPGQPGGGSRSRMAIVIASVTAVAVIVAGGIWMATGGDDDGGGSGGSGGSAAEGKLLHQVPMAKVSDDRPAKGMWTTDKNLVKTGDREIAGYPLQGGKAEWKIPLKGEICWTSEHVTQDGLAAVLFQDGERECTKVALADFEKGELRWQKQASARWDDAMAFDEVAIGGGTVAAGSSLGGVGWSTSGRQLWKPEDDASCYDRGYAGDDKKLVAVRSCGEADPPKYQVQTLDPKTRKAKSTYNVQSGAEYVHIASTDPLVLGVDTGDSDSGSAVTDFVALDDSGTKAKERGRIDVVAGRYEARCTTVNVDGCSQIAVDKRSDALYLSSEKAPKGQGDIGNKVIGFNLKTGKKLGQSELEVGKALVPVSVEKDGSVIAYQEPRYDGPGAVVSIDPKSFEKKELWKQPKSSHAAEQSLSSDSEGRRLAYTGDLLYIGSDTLKRPTSSGGGKRPLVAIFGEG